jgi:iron complex outermembrane recepter protein
MCKRSFYVILTSIIGLMFFFGDAVILYAQEGSSDEFTLEEITVTAEKRTENLQKVAMSVAVMQGEEISNQGAVSLADILKNIPNVSTSEAGDKGSTVNIRGLGSDLPSGTGEAAVSTNFDGAYQMRSEAGMFGFFDVDRVEVLRGPQGTLYGRNSTGGVVNIVSAKPKTDKVEGYANLEVGDYKKMKTEAAINVPVSDKFAGRLAFVSTKQNAYTEDDHGYRESQEGLATRLQLRYVPTNEAYVNLLYSFTQRNGGMFGTVTKTNFDSGKYYVNSSTYPYDQTSKMKNRDAKISLTAEFPLGPGIVTMLPTYERMKGRSSSFGVFSGAPGTGPVSDEPTFSGGGSPWNNETKTAELRYANKSDSKVTWVGGLWWTSTDEPGSPDDTGYQSLKWYNTKSAFSQVTYPFSDTFRGIIGARYTMDKKGYDNTDLTPVSASYEFNYFDWKAGIEKDLAQDIMGYLTLASGHRSGGYNEFQDGQIFGMESAVSAEMGMKGRFLNNRLQANGDIFYYDYKDYQVVNNYIAYDEEEGADRMFSDFFNVPKAINYGAEFDVTALVGDATQLNFALAYLKNQYKSEFYLNPDPFSPRVNMKGKPLPHSPEYTFNVGINHMFLFSDGSTLTPSASYRWVDEQYFGLASTADALGPAYAILDLAMNYNSGKSWTLNFYANNALNEHYYTMSFSSNYFVGNPRTTGITFNVKF